MFRQKCSCIQKKKKKRLLIPLLQREFGIEWFPTMDGKEMPRKERLRRAIFRSETREKQCLATLVIFLLIPLLEFQFLNVI